MDRKAKGDFGEDLVCAELIKRGHKIIKRNFRKSYGEIDIISQIDRFIVFTEVKTRKRGSMVSGLEAVTQTKRRRIVQTADFYLCNVFCGDGVRLQPRYDIAEVTVTGGDTPTLLRLDIYEDAFTTDGIYTIY